MALNLMLQGTMSNAGKSLLAAALCRIFKQDGYRVAPFKSQNMALNSFITAAGGVLGKVISEAGIVTYITEHASFLSNVGIFFPFIIAAILKTAQGSSTVAITTTAGILGLYSAEGSLMSALGLTSPFAAALTVMAIGAGAMTVSHANDSYFWVVTNFGGMKAEDGYKTQTMCTLLMGLASIVFIWIISLFFH